MFGARRVADFMESKTPLKERVSARLPGVYNDSNVAFASGVQSAMNVESEYQSRVAALSMAERIRRAEALFRWSGDYLRRSILAELGPLSDQDLKWEIALRRYGSDPRTRTLIEELRARAAR